MYVDCHPEPAIATEHTHALAPILTEPAAQLESWIEMFDADTEPGADR